MSALIEIRNLSKSFGPATVLHSVDVDVQAGEILTILGQSGGGKSTLLRCINLLEIPSGGDITIAGDPVVSDGRVVVKDLARLRQKVGMVFQRFNLFPHLTAIENVILAQTKAAGISEDQAIETAVRLIRRVGLAHRAMAFPDQMSGGEQQRVAIARALALKPTALLFDEPTSALDPESTREVLTVMRELAEGGMTMVIVTHEVPFAQQISDQVAFVDAGYIVEQGPPSEVIGAPRERADPGVSQRQQRRVMSARCNCRRRRWDRRAGLCLRARVCGPGGPRGRPVDDRDGLVGGQRRLGDPEPVLPGALPGLGSHGAPVRGAVGLAALRAAVALAAVPALAVRVPQVLRQGRLRQGSGRVGEPRGAGRRAVREVAGRRDRNDPDPSRVGPCLPRRG